MSVWPEAAVRRKTAKSPCTNGADSPSRIHEAANRRPHTLVRLFFRDVSRMSINAPMADVVNLQIASHLGPGVVSVLRG